MLAPTLTPLLAEAAQAGQRHEQPVEVELSAGRDGQRRATLLPAGDNQERIALDVSGTPLAISPGVFAQANGSLLEPLCEAVLGAAGEGKRAAELYCGAGLFTRGLAGQFARVLAVESNPHAAADLAANLSAGGLAGRVEVLARPVERALRRITRWQPGTVVLDPPRTGLAPAVGGALVDSRAERIVYVSCDPATLARDLRSLCDGPYTLTQLEAFDLFPQTPHVEAVAVLRATATGARGPDGTAAVHRERSGRPAKREKKARARRR